MSSRTVLIAVGILAASIAYAGYQTSDRLVYAPPTDDCMRDGLRYRFEEKRIDPYHYGHC